MNTELNKKIIWTAIFSMIVLFFMEILMRYDSWDRQIALSITNLGTLAIYLVIHRRFQKKYNIALPWFVIWILAVGVWLDAAGNFAHFYAQYTWWDDFTHTVGTMAVANAFFVVLYNLNKFGRIKIGKFALAIFTVSLSVLVSSFYEVTELWGDWLFKTYRIGDKFDTATDLQWNLLGAMVVVLIGIWVINKKKIKDENNKDVPG